MPPATEMQEMEMEMVQGMYDTYVLLSDDPPSYCVSLAATEEEPPQLKVTITYPSEEYPESAACGVAVECIAKARRIQVGAITKQLAATCEENIGMHSVVLVLQQVQEFLSHAVEEEEKADLLRRGEVMAAEATKRAGAVEEDPTIRLGTAVTRELFDEWSRRHNAEKAKARAERETKEARTSASKLSGRQLWDNSLRSADWELFGAAAEEEGGVDVDFSVAGDDLDEDEFDLE
ncbi:RWD domain-containing protein [Novymonas esmeraldas]|uniref:RWD domain-containing protein n=1 Tax=Novymonas esmeraldas TaxID=1808958 RepID=A0AAW0FAE2_9TRYP